MVFLIADVSHAILGADFWSQFSLQVDLRRRRLVDTVTSLSVNAFFDSLPLLLSAFLLRLLALHFRIPLTCCQSIRLSSDLLITIGPLSTLSALSIALRLRDSQSTHEHVVCLQIACRLRRMSSSTC